MYPGDVPHRIKFGTHWIHKSVGISESFSNVLPNYTFSKHNTIHDVANHDGICIPGGGGTVICSYICRLGSFLGFKILISIFLGIFRKMNILGYFGGSSQNWTIFRGHFYAF